MEQQQKVNIEVVSIDDLILDDLRAPFTQGLRHRCMILFLEHELHE